MSTSYGSPAAAPSKTSRKAIASLILGLLSLVTCLLTGIPAIIFGILGLSSIGKSQGRLTGHGLAVAGIVLGGIGTVLSIPAIIVAVALPALNAARETARQNVSRMNMQQIARSMIQYELEKQQYPSDIVDADGKPLLSWRVVLLPYLDEQGLYDKFHLDEPWDSPHNKQLIKAIPAVYQCPNFPADFSDTMYLLPVGPGTMFENHLAAERRDGTRKMSSSMVQRGDGLAQTIMLVEADVLTSVSWTKPGDVDVDRKDPGFGVGHLRPRGFLAVFADTHVQFISNQLSAETLNKLFSYDGKRFNETPLDMSELERP